MIPRILITYVGLWGKMFYVLSVVNSIFLLFLFDFGRTHAEFYVFWRSSLLFDYILMDLHGFSYVLKIFIDFRRVWDDVEWKYIDFHIVWRCLLFFLGFLRILIDFEGFSHLLAIVAGFMWIFRVFRRVLEDLYGFSCFFVVFCCFGTMLDEIT